MNSISKLISVLSLASLSVLSCPLYEDKYCCNGEEFVNDCFVQSAGKDTTDCRHNQCLQQIVFNSTEWQEVNQYTTTLDSTINARLLDSHVRLNYGCWDHQRLKQAVKVQLDNSKNYYVKLQLLCDPGNYAHVYFNVPYIDDEGHVLMPHAEYKAMEYPHTEDDILDVFTDENIIVTTEAPIVGNDRDEHNCIASAGYSWCEVKGICYRPWEQDCTDHDTSAISSTASVIVHDGDGRDGNGSMGLLDERLQRIGIAALFVISGIGIVVYCVARKRHSENKGKNTSVQTNESSVSYENLL